MSVCHVVVGAQRVLSWQLHIGEGQTRHVQAINQQKKAAQMLVSLGTFESRNNQNEKAYNVDFLV